MYVFIFKILRGYIQAHIMATNVKLEKTRYKTTFEGNKVDIDIYPDGRSSAEIEYEIELVNLPDYCGEEITGNKEWSNLSIAKKKYK